MWENCFVGLFIGLMSFYPIFVQIIRKTKQQNKQIEDKVEIKQQNELKTVKEEKQSFFDSQNIIQSQFNTSESNSTPPQSKKQSSSSKSRSISQSNDQIEILLHNVSHTDMVLSIHDPYGYDESIIARPKFSCFREISTKIETKIREVSSDDLSTIQHPVYSREANARHPIIRSFNTNQFLDVGFNLLNHEVIIDHIEQLRFRQNDRDKIFKQPTSTAPALTPSASTAPPSAPSSSSVRLSAVYFPLLSMLIPKWLNEVEGRGKGNSKKIVFLVSGQGTPRDESARIQDNSTKVTAIIMEMFLKKVYPDLEVIQVPSPTINLFRYADNIVFVKRILKPKLDKIRNDLAAKIGAKWLENFHVTMSFADGSTARISAISAVIRSYRPSYMHFWQLKTFWYETKICMDDIECHSYAEISATPPMQLTNVDDQVKLVVEEMLRFKEEFKRIRQLGSDVNDLASFWLRKSKKPVLAVLLVQKFGTDSEPRLFRGTNMEVSMPTGSLCAERNVIGSALGSDLTLRREDIQYVAVLSLSLEPSHSHETNSNQNNNENNTNNINNLEIETSNDFIVPPPPATPQWSTQSEPCSQYEQSPSTPPSRPADMKRAMSQPVVSSSQAGGNQQGSGSGSSTPNRTKTVTVFDVPRQPTLDAPSSSSLSTCQGEDCQHPKALFNSEETPARASKDNSLRTGIRQFPQSKISVEESMNPLQPCGACHEWLKKIAEVNPSFSVITFTDSECKGVYVEQIDMM